MKTRSFRLFFNVGCFSMLFMTGISYVSCNRQIDDKSLVTGDLLFAGMLLDKQEDLSSAINEVTQTNEQTNYFHVGITEVHDDTVWVIHAAPGKGVCREQLEKFTNSSDLVDVYRLKDSYRFFISDALERSRALIGQPYDSVYIMGNGHGYYCSGLIFTLFEGSDVFSLEPMTFKDRETGEFHPGWVDYYEKIGRAIPEGLPGCNPNGMAASPSLTFLGRLK
ncbi:YiiX/YebB-like N1pC/P60 family cysteine hydrolase [Geofilum sp. OHC36d9]|uniref:YiiX/YebB-like N1pC/P60 family cysteine hydrolase n=1 Tax=Geofilum sp. OHC36d9 TaxID=3458413 RepID=UPI004034323F